MTQYQTMDETNSQRLKKARTSRGYGLGQAFALKNGISINTYLGHENSPCFIHHPHPREFNTNVLQLSVNELISNQNQWDAITYHLKPTEAKPSTTSPTLIKLDTATLGYAMQPRRQILTTSTYYQSLVGR